MERKEFDPKLIAHAKDYIDDLAKGINPFTKEEIPEEDIVNNVKISRCLFYVSEVLGEIVTNGNVKKPKQPKKVTFSLEGLDLSAFNYSSSPVNISDIVAQINSFRAENMSKLKTSAITDWLVDLKLLEVLIYNEKTRKYPTAMGNEMGIFKEDRMGLHGLYSVVLYDQKAQHFIIDNLPAVLEGGYNATKSRSEKESDSRLDNFPPDI